VSSGKILRPVFLEEKILTLMAVNSGTMIDRADKRKQKCGHFKQKNTAVHTANYSAADLKVKQSHYRHV